MHLYIAAWWRAATMDECCRRISIPAVACIASTAMVTAQRGLGLGSGLGLGLGLGSGLGFELVGAEDHEERHEQREGEEKAKERGEEDEEALEGRGWGVKGRQPECVGG